MSDTELAYAKADAIHWHEGWQRAMEKLARVQDLHEPMDGKCSSCMDAYGDAEEWPCATARALA